MEYNKQLGKGDGVAGKTTRSGWRSVRMRRGRGMFQIPAWLIPVTAIVIATAAAFTIETLSITFRKDEHPRTLIAGDSANKNLAVVKSAFQNLQCASRDGNIYSDGRGAGRVRCRDVALRTRPGRR
jgi:hypothetical protein